jgi:hypothetical protein
MNPPAALELRMRVFGAGGIVRKMSAGNDADAPAMETKVGQRLQIERKTMRRTIHGETWARGRCFQNVSVGIVDGGLVAAVLVHREERRDVAGKC